MVILSLCLLYDAPFVCHYTSSVPIVALFGGKYITEATGLNYIKTSDSVQDEISTDELGLGGN